MSQRAQIASVSMINDYVDDDDNGVDKIDDVGIDCAVTDDAYDDDEDNDNDDADDMDGMWFVAAPTRYGRCHRTNFKTETKSSEDDDEEDCEE